MQKFIIAIAILCMAASCDNNNNTAKTRALIIPGHYTPIPEPDVKRMAQHYIDLVAANPVTNLVQQINMDANVLLRFMRFTTGIKFIMAADGHDVVTVIVQSVDSRGVVYNDIREIFLPTRDAGMRHLDPVCPPQANCEILAAGSNDGELDAATVTSMAADYVTLVTADPKTAIQHVNVDVTMMNALLLNQSGVKLICIADSKRNTTGVVMQLWDGGKYYYHDINNFFPSQLRGMNGQNALCPQPPNCGLPFDNPPTKDSSHVGGDSTANKAVDHIHAPEQNH